MLNERPPRHHYVCSPSEFRWLPGARDAVFGLAGLGYTVVLVSNQRGVARGLLGEADLRAIEAAIRSDLGAGPAPIAGFYYCPHDLDDGCDCRKPRPGLVLRAAREHGFDLARSVLVGDSETDVLVGLAVGCRTIRVGPGRRRSRADEIAADLAEAVALLEADAPATRELVAAFG